MLRIQQSKYTIIFTLLLLILSNCGKQEPIHMPSLTNNHWMKLGEITLFRNSISGFAENSRGELFFISAERLFWLKHGSRKWEFVCDLRCYDFSKIFLDKRTDFIYLFGGNSGIIKSTDNGKSWTLINNHLSNGEIASLIPYGTNSIIAISVNGDIFISETYSDVWKKLDELYTGYYRIREAAINKKTSTIYLIPGYSPILYKYSITERKYQKIRVSEDYTNIRSIYIGENGTIFIGTSDGEICISYDHGNSWTTKKIDSDITSISQIMLKDDYGTMLACVHLHNICISYNRGQTWETAWDSIPQMRPYIIYPSKTGRIWINTYIGLIHTKISSSDFISAEFKNIEKSYISKIAINKLYGNKIYVIDFDNGRLFRLIKNGNCYYFVFTYPWLSSVRDIEFDSYGNTYILSKTMDSEYVLSTSIDGGKTWEEKSINEPVRWLAIDSTGTIYTYSDYIALKSDDGGNSWQEIYSSPSGEIYYISAFSDTLVFLETRDAIYLSTDRCQSWEKVFDIPTPLPIKRLDNGALITASHCHSGICISYDNGRIWNWIAEDEIPVTLELIEVARDGRIIAASREEGYIFYSEDEGETWTVDKEKMPLISAIAMDRNGYIYTASDRTLYRSYYSIYTKQKELP